MIEFLPLFHMFERSFIFSFLGVFHDFKYFLLTLALKGFLLNLYLV